MDMCSKMDSGFINGPQSPGSGGQAAGRSALGRRVLIARLLYSWNAHVICVSKCSSRIAPVYLLWHFVASRAV